MQFSTSLTFTADRPLLEIMADIESVLGSPLTPEVDEDGDIYRGNICHMSYYVCANYILEDMDFDLRSYNYTLVFTRDGVWGLDRRRRLAEALALLVAESLSMRFGSKWVLIDDHDRLVEMSMPVESAGEN